MRKILYISITLFWIYAGTLSFASGSPEEQHRGDRLKPAPVLEQGSCPYGSDVPGNSSAYPCLHNAYETSFNSENTYTYYDRTSSLINRYRYIFNVSSRADSALREQAGWNLVHEASFRRSHNERFDRTGTFRDLNWFAGRSESKDNYLLDYGLVFNYNQAGDKATKEGGGYRISRTRRGTGISILAQGKRTTDGAEPAPVFEQGDVPRTTEPALSSTLPALSPSSFTLSSKILYISSEELNTAQNDNREISGEGYNFESHFDISRSLSPVTINLNGHIEQLSIDNDYFRRYGLAGKFNLENPDIRADFNLNKETKNIYLLYDRVDTFVRTNYRADIMFRRNLAEGMSVTLRNRFGVGDSRFYELRNRNYLEIDNDLNVSASYQVWRLNFFTGGSNNRFSRTFKGDVGNRYQERNSLITGLSLQINHADSLTISRKLSLTKTDYSAAGTKLDNDTLSDEYQISSYLTFRERIRLINHFNYTKREEIFLDAGMSGNNKVLRTYNLLPGLDIRLNDFLWLRQKYHLRADYDDYSFDLEDREDRMYRKFSASFSLMSLIPYRTTVNRAISGYMESETGFSNQIPGRKELILGTEYIYDTNSSGTLSGRDKYVIYSENEYHTLEFEAGLRADRLQMSLKPRFIWQTGINEPERRGSRGSQYDHRFQIAYLFPGSLGRSTLSINPSGRSRADILWRINFAVEVAL